MAQINSAEKTEDLTYNLINTFYSVKYDGIS